MDKTNNLMISEKAHIFKALSHPTRLWMVEQLANGERCVCEFAAKLDIDFSTVSKHLTVLKRAGVVVDEKRGKQVYYTLKVPCVLKFVSCVENVIKKRIKEHYDLIK